MPIAYIVAVPRTNRIVGIFKNIVVDPEFSPHPAVDSSGHDPIVIVIEDMTLTKAVTGQPGITVSEVVVIISDSPVVVIAVGGANQAGLVAVIEVIPGEGHKGAVFLGVK